MIVAIDGYSSCGKSTLAKQLAGILNMAYIDTGAMYRSVTLYVLNLGVELEDLSQIKAALDSIDISFKNLGGANKTFLNGQDVSEEIRSKKVNDQVSVVSSLSMVREKLVKQQKILGGKSGVVMDGRDIGTVVFPNADFKFFITADVDIRAQRRHLENISKGKEIGFEEVKANLIARDKIDSSRAISPLVMAKDAILIDNSLLTKQEQLDLVLYYINYGNG